MAQADETAIHAGWRMDRLPVGRFHRRMLAIIGAGMFLDGFEIYLSGGVLGALVKDGWSDIRMNAAFVSSTMIGMVIGAWLSGILGDRFGRRFSYQINLALFGAASLAAACAPNMETLIALRFVMGIGLGAEIVVGYATFAEFVPPATRGRWLALLSVLTNCSLAVASFLGLWLIPILGWRPMFAIAGIGALIVWFLRKSMPESPRWLEAKGRFAEADAVLRRIEAEAGAEVGAAPAWQPTPAPIAPAAHGSILDLFSPALLRRTLIGITVNVTVGFVVYGFVVWLPTLLLKQGHGIGASLGYTAVMSLGAPIGALCGMVLADRVGRKVGLGGFSLLAAMFGAVYPFAHSAPMLMACGFAIVTCIYAIIALGFAVYVPELFPTAYRLRGAGLCGTSGRIASAGVQFVVVALFASAGLAGVVALLVGTLLVQAFVMFVFGVETARQPLEALAPANTTADPAGSGQSMPLSG